MNQESITLKHEVIHLADDDFDDRVIQSDQPVLVDFWADWCQPCHAISPTVKTLAEEYGGRLRVGKVNVDANPATTAQFGIRGIPALLLFKNGHVIEQIVGVQPKEEIARIIDKHL